MRRGRDARRFGPGPYIVGLRREESRWGAGVPFELPAVAAAEALRLDAPVTFLDAPERYLRATLEQTE